MFWKRKPKQEIENGQIAGIEYPKIGERWIRIAKNGDPWGEEGNDFVEILDVREGWVRFGRLSVGLYMPPNSFRARDYRMPVSAFFSLFQKYVPLPGEEEIKIPDESK